MIFIIIVNIIIIVIVIITIIIVIVKIVIIITIQIRVPFKQVSLPMVRRCRGIFLLFEVAELFLKRKTFRTILSDLMCQIVPNSLNLHISTTSSSCHQRFAMRTSSAAVILSLFVV